MVELDAAMTSDEKWEAAKRAFDETGARIEQCEREVLEMRSQVNELLQLCVRITKSLCEALSSACRDN